MTMTRRSIGYVLKAGVVVAAVLLTVSVRATLQDRCGRRQQGALLPSGHAITPVAVQNAVQLYLNPGLAAYPDFVAGQAVRSTLSPDGTTLAVITAGQNSLYKAGWDRRRAELDPVRVPLRRPGREQAVPCADAGPEADQRARRTRVCAGRRHAVRHGRK